MSNAIEQGKRVLFSVAVAEAYATKTAPEQGASRMLTPGIVASLEADGFHAIVLAEGKEYFVPVALLKLGTQDTDPAAWMLHDGKTSTPVVHLDGCYICEDPEFAQMGLPLCRPCPDCQRNGRGLGHIAADDNVCHYCRYEDGPDDYPEAAAG